MATAKRIDSLKRSCNQLKGFLDNAEEVRGQLIALKSSGISAWSGEGGEQLQQMIIEADEAAKSYKKIHIFMKSVRDRAIGGEEV